jgi:hypothetical protein
VAALPARSWSGASVRIRLANFGYLGGRLVGLFNIDSWQEVKGTKTQRQRDPSLALQFTTDAALTADRDEPSLD